MIPISLTRRDVLRWAALAPFVADSAQAAPHVVNVALAGATAAGLDLLRTLLALDGVAVVAVFDQDRDRAASAGALVTRARHPAPKLESDSLERFCESDTIHLVVNAAEPDQRTVVSIAAMRAGKHIAAPAPAARTLEECWSLVETSVKTGCDAILLEPSCYGRESLFVLNLIASGVLGDPLFVETGEPIPAGWWLDVNRGDRFEYLVAMDSTEVGNTLARTARGRVVCSSRYRPPHFHEGLVRIQGTHGAYSGAIQEIYIEGRSPEVDTFESLTAYQDYQSPVWKSPGALTPESLALRRLIHNIAHRLPPDTDVFDLATWSAMPILARTSAEQGAQPVDYPDFTRGQWRHRSSIDPGRIA